MKHEAITVEVPGEGNSRNIYRGYDEYHVTPIISGDHPQFKRPMLHVKIPQKPGAINMKQEEAVEARRGDIIRLYGEGKTYKEIAAALGVNYSTVYNDLTRLRAQGLITESRLNQPKPVPKAEPKVETPKAESKPKAEPITLADFDERLEKGYAVIGLVEKYREIAKVAEASLEAESADVVAFLHGKMEREVAKLCG